MSATILTVENLTTEFPIVKGFLSRRTGEVRAVESVSFSLAPGEILGLVGESGCGKSTLARSIMRLVDTTAGKVILDTIEFSALPQSDLRRHRPDIQMIFQDPYASLNPRMTVFDTLSEALAVRERSSDVTAAVAALMERVGLAPAGMRKFPHEFSGGQRQRIAIARALAPKPKVLIADEPVSALDVSIAAQIINLLQQLCAEMSLAMIFISHDLSVVSHLAHKTAVMYLGRIVESGPTAAVLESPAHPYTKALISAVPTLDADRNQASKRIILTGEPPSPINPPSGCVFHPRCRFAIPRCAEVVPDLVDVSNQADHRAACIRLGSI
jgi:oligopeptide transport system ATP-binding protein